MKTIVMLLVLVLVFVTGCASFSGGPGGYAISGTSAHPEFMAATLSMNHVNETNAQTNQDCVRSGKCYGYAGGGYGNDYWYNYRNVRPPQPDQPAPVAGTWVQNPVPPQGGEYATKEQLDCVDAKASDALRTTAGGQPVHGRYHHVCREHLARRPPWRRRPRRSCC